MKPIVKKHKGANKDNSSSEESSKKETPVTQKRKFVESGEEEELTATSKKPTYQNFVKAGFQSSESVCKKIMVFIACFFAISMLIN